jgi:hypothetical protein
VQGSVFAFRSGSRVRLDPATEAAMSEADGTQRVVLTSGTVTAMVVKMGPGERFIVHTDDADVEAHGTVFRVSRRDEPGCGMRTSVRVVEGRISVRDAQGERFLTVDQDWSSPCKPARPAATVVPTEVALSNAIAAAPVALPKQPQSASAPAPAPPPSASDLAEQNQIYAHAMTDKSMGDARSAVDELSTLLSRYPQTPLREAASVNRMKLADSFDHEGGKRWAKAYLAEYPRGFARADAEQILAQ